jgi:branched-chain amino acid transport system permease protein
MESSLSSTQTTLVHGRAGPLSLLVARKLALVMSALLVVAFPFVASPLWLSIAVAMLLALPGALALNLLTGVAGLISIGNAAFMAIGAAVAVELGGRLGWPFPMVVLAGGCASAMIGALVGTPSLRLRGIYLLVSTMALHFLSVFMFREFEIRTVGEAGFHMPAPIILGTSIIGPVAWYFVFLSVGTACYLGFVNLMKTGTGRSWLLVRERDLAAAVVGINVARAKITVFTASSFAIGIQGALFAYYIEVVNYELFTLERAISYVAMILVGGMGSALGSLYGAAFVVGLPYALQELSLGAFAGWSWFSENLVDLQNFVYGASIILFLLFEPKGLAAIFSRVIAAVRKLPTPKFGSSHTREG